jgi:hypothetical protein
MQSAGTKIHLFVFFSGILFDILDSFSFAEEKHKDNVWMILRLVQHHLGMKSE